MEIEEKNVLAAYAVADESGRNLLKTLFSSVDFDKDNRPVTERIKTFEDACKELGDKHQFVVNYKNMLSVATREDFMVDGWGADIVAYAKLRIIVAALNEGWEPQFDEDEERWYPWHWLYTQEGLDGKSEDWYKNRAFRKVGDEGDYKATGYVGFAFANSSDAPSDAYATVGSHLCLKDKNTATYCGTQFVDLWADFYLIRK